jgi:hypothetical protein
VVEILGRRTGVQADRIGRSIRIHSAASRRGRACSRSWRSASSKASSMAA